MFLSELLILTRHSIIRFIIERGMHTSDNQVRPAWPEVIYYQYTMQCSDKRHPMASGEQTIDSREQEEDSFLYEKSRFKNVPQARGGASCEQAAHGRVISRWVRTPRP